MLGAMSQRPVTGWIAFVAAVALLAGLGLAVRQWRAQPLSTRASAPADTSGDVVEQALGQIPAPDDSAAIKARWLDEVPGADVANLTQEGREIFVRAANSQHCTCGCGFTLAGCRASDMTCDVSRGRVEALLDSVRSGRLRSAQGLRERPTSG